MPPSAIAAAIMEDSMDARAQAVQALFTICFRGGKKSQGCHSQDTQSHGKEKFVVAWQQGNKKFVVEGEPFLPNPGTRVIRSLS